LEFEEDDSTVEVNSSGAYPTVCIELSLDGLAVNAVLQVVGLLFYYRLYYILLPVKMHHTSSILFV
jgi:hypothetical protein